MRAHTDSLIESVWCANHVAAVLDLAVHVCCTRKDALVVMSVDVEEEIQAVLTVAYVNPAWDKCHLQPPDLDLVPSRRARPNAARSQYMWAMVRTQSHQPLHRLQSSNLLQICARCAVTLLKSSGFL